MATAGDVFTQIRERGETTRADIATATGLSRTAVAARIAALTAAGLVLEGEQVPSTGGRPATPVSFNVDAGVVLSVSVGISRTRLAVCDLAGTVLRLSDIDQEVALGPDDLMPDVAKRLDALLEEYPDAEVFGIGLSLPGPVDRERGCSRDSPILRGWDGVALRPYFDDVIRLGNVPVILDNDANAIALAERGGELEGHSDLLVLKASTGLGAGIIAGGALQRGASGAAGEFGHNKIAVAAGRACRCGDTGCLETVAGGWAIVHELQQQGYAVRHLRDVVELANGGDPETRRMIRDSGRYVGEGISPAVNLLNPKVLVITGDMAGAYDIFVAGLRQALYGNATAMATRELEVVASVHGGAAAPVGGAVMALDEVLSARAVDALLAT
ncbi:ROK family protein [Mycolicibacterium fluoranthenivorans]|uniref:Putative NBD/HSP70 family sugar kinase n=1 Tax=Mycolicibacterium fluoranthenivorans TaxID=258505 RepID=A0A7X5U5Y1_9MYCO|nr:ROK family protein [Mycolicibacterium fluoranthenivorans]MCV7356587.1 ROK family protein [Mycolicibacterium fluoranthenivorans]NIH99022.1 putative NBD/HSP70 family sugar kinase [Mycolicibacterium fluoranthenivorans]